MSAVETNPRCSKPGPARRLRVGAAGLLGLALCAVWLSPARADDLPLEAEVLEVRGDAVKLGKGEQHGITVGQIFDLYQEARVFLLPLTNGEVPLVKSHRRLARAQVFEVGPTSAVARMIPQDPAANPERLSIEAHDVRAIHNPTAAAPNRRPEFVSVPAPKAVAWREVAPIELRISNEADDAVVFRWSINGGKLEERTTLRPLNRWTAPAVAGTYRLNVSVRDSAGNEAHTTLELVSTGIRGRKQPQPTRFEPGRTFGPASRYGFVADLAFDGLGRRYFLNPKQGWGGTPLLKVETPGQQLLSLPVTDRSFTAIAAAEPQIGLAGALFAIDADQRTILRYSFLGATWDQVLKRPPLALGAPDGGSGNARFENPIDLVVSGAGEVYVLDAGQRCVQVFTVLVPPGKEEAAAEGRFLVSFGRPGDGPLMLKEPRALSIGRDGTVYVLDNGRKTVVVYRGWRPVAEFSVGAAEDELTGISVDPFTSEVYVLDRKAGAVRRYSRGGQLLGRFGEDAERGHPARLSFPRRMRMDATRTLWVVDRDGASMVRFAHDGQFLGRTGGIEFGGPLRVAGLPSGGFAALDRYEFQVTCFDAEGWITSRFGSEGSRPGQLEDPIDVAVSATGELFVLDAEKKSVSKYSPSGAYLGSIGRAGSGPQDLMGTMDLSAVNDRSYLAVLQQRPEDAFNLLSPGAGRSERSWGQFTGELTPRFGCVTGVTGSLGSRGQESSSPWFWTVDEDRERVYRSRPGVAPAPLTPEFDEINDMEPSVAGQVFVADPGEYQIVVFDGDGAQVTVLKSERFGIPWDLGIDDFGTVYVFDNSRSRVVELVPAD